MRFKEKLRGININFKKVFLTILSLRKIFIRIILYMGKKLIKYYEKRIGAKILE